MNNCEENQAINDIICDREGFGEEVCHIIFIMKTNAEIVEHTDRNAAVLNDIKKILIVEDYITEWIATADNITSNTQLENVCYCEFQFKKDIMMTCVHHAEMLATDLWNYSSIIVGRDVGHRSVQYILQLLCAKMLGI